MNFTEASLVLNLVPKLGARRIRYLLERFGSALEVLNASEQQLMEVERMSVEVAQRIVRWEQDVDLAGEIRLIEQHDVEVLAIEDPTYPENLRQIYDPPVVLYVQGKLESRDQKGFALVGSRNATSYGMNCAKKLGFQIGLAGYTVISGLARGIDTAAHEGALASQGRTVAVIGAGLTKLYPPENRSLADRIAKQGAVISEFPMQYPPDYRTFPMRNRIVSALSQGIVVVEAPLKSGALITVQQGLEQGKNIYAVPGTIDRVNSMGCHRLIQQGAKLVMGVEDILEECDELFAKGILARDSFTTPNPGDSSIVLSSEESKLMETLTSIEEPIHMNELVECSELPTSQVSVALMRLEMKGLIQVDPGKWISKKSH